MKKFYRALGVYLVCWMLWALWKLLFLPRFGIGLVGTVLDAAVIKSIIWIPLPLLILRPQKLFEGKFPWLGCIILLCGVTAFLHSVRLLNGLLNTRAFFDPMFILLSAFAGVIEELCFRGCYYRALEGCGFWFASTVSSVMFAMFHYPEILLGNWQPLISWRALLIFVMGIVFCWMYRKWKNLALNMTVHTYWNLLSYLFCLA